jgi:hypothetical protein
MNPQTAWARQPFLGLALSAMVGITIADLSPSLSPTLVVVLLATSIIGWLWRRSVAVYPVVAFGFFFLHSLRTTDTPGHQLVDSLGDDPRPITVHGAVVNEPKTSGRGTASFLLQADSIEIDGESRPCHAKWFVRWKQNVRFGDEVRLFGLRKKLKDRAIPGNSINGPTWHARTFIVR